MIEVTDRLPFPLCLVSLPFSLYIHVLHCNWANCMIWHNWSISDWLFPCYFYHHHRLCVCVWYVCVWLLTASIKSMPCHTTPHQYDPVSLQNGFCSFCALMWIGIHSFSFGFPSMIKGRCYSNYPLHVLYMYIIHCVLMEYCISETHRGCFMYCLSTMVLAFCFPDVCVCVWRFTI